MAALVELDRRGSWSGGPIAAGSGGRTQRHSADRKDDPGELFDWGGSRRMACAYDSTCRGRVDAGRSVAGCGGDWPHLAIPAWRRARHAAALVRAFQRRWRQTRCDGVLDRRAWAWRSRLLPCEPVIAGQLPAPGCRRPDGRSRREAGEESPGSTGTRCRVTPGGGDPRESATESKPPAGSASARLRVRVKGCGKSAPRRRQRRRHGKPHREQDQVGTTAQAPRGGRAQAGFRAGRPGRSREARGDTGPRGMAILRPSGRGQNPAYRPPAPKTLSGRTQGGSGRTCPVLVGHPMAAVQRLSTELFPSPLFLFSHCAYDPAVENYLDLSGCCDRLPPAYGQGVSTACRIMS